ncbi:hypothetical protein ACWEPC_03605 [Nonomuraea sp. NPDC004297]
MFTDQPQLAVEILRDLMHIELPETPLVQEEDRTFNTRISDDIEPDLVFTLGPPPSPVHAIIVEIQKDKKKDPRQLTRYAAAAWLMLRCDVSVLVICPNQADVAHYARPVESGLTGYRLQSHVLGPDSIPAITDPQEAAAHLALAVMSVMAHGRDRKVVEAFGAALEETRNEHAPKYTEYAYSMAGPEIRRLLEEIMTSTDWPVYSPFAREHFGRGLKEGETIGEARSLLRVLAVRGLDVPDSIRTRITNCTDATQLETWVARAVTAQTIQDLFNDPDQDHHQGQG